MDSEETGQHHWLIDFDLKQTKKEKDLTQKEKRKKNAPGD